MRFPGFIGPGYTLQSVVADCQRCVNWYPELNELQTQADGETAALIPTPGLALFATLGTDPIRGCHYTSSGRLAVVSGNTVYRVGADGSSAVAGTLLTSTGPVSMDDNGTQLIIVDGPYGYILSLVTGTLTQISSDGFAGGDTVVFLDGYFIVNVPNTGQFSISGLYDGFSWDALDFGVAEGSPDNVVAVVANQRQVWLFGQQTIEVWWNSGNADFPFTRIDGAFIEYGCAASQTAHKFNNAVIWLGGGDRAKGIVWISQGFLPKRISNHAVEFAISKIADLSTATAWVYQDSGHVFYCLNLPGADTTWVYDSATEQWSERTFKGNYGQERHRAECHSLAYGKHIVGDYQNGKIYELSNSTATDNGTAIVRLRVAPHISDGLVRIFYDKFQLDMSVGQGLDGNPTVGKFPRAALSFSDDYGHTWSSDIFEDLGGIGEFRTRAIWRKLGQARNRVFRVAISDPIRPILLGADLNIRKGIS